MNILTIEHLDTGYDKKQVLFDVSLEIPKNKVTLLVGSNGSGKSTLLKAIYGIVEPWNQNTKIVFDEKDITGCRTSDMIKKGIVYIPQKDALFEDMTVKENIEIAGIQTISRKELKSSVESVFEQLPKLQELRKRECNRLSGGERKQVSLAMALINQPKMIMFDEPLAGVSPDFVNKIILLIKEIKRKGISILLIEHRIKSIFMIADNTFGLRLGKVYNKTVESLDQVNEVMV